MSQFQYSMTKENLQVKQKIFMNKKAYAALVKEVFSKSKQELHEIYNLGVYNDITKGYCVLALKEANADIGTIERALNSFSAVFDLHSASDALKTLNDFNTTDKKTVPAKEKNLMHTSVERF